MFIFDNPFGISNNISLNSLMKGGKTSINIVKIINEITVMTKSNEISLGIFNTFCSLLAKLQIIFDITNEQIIKRKKSLKVHNINRVIRITANLKYRELFKLKFVYYFSEYPSPLVLA